MSPMPGVLHEAFGRCVRASLEAVVVVGVLLAVQAVLRRRMPPAWAYWLWLILLARLVLPWTPESALSVFNLLPQSTRVEVEAPIEGVAPPEALPATLMPVPAAPAPVAQAPRPVIALTFRDLLVAAWLAGVAVALAWPASNAIRFRRKALASSVIHHAALGGLLEDCKRLMGVTAPIEMRACDAVTSPAVLGFLRPRLLIPPMLGARLSRQEMRFVFLHELAHLKRCDIPVNWLLALVQAVHWFNPAVWYAFWRMRSDRELACDALALSRLRAEESSAYGHTLLRLFEHVRAPRHVPSVAGISEGRSQLTRRIVMITRFKGKSPWGMVSGVAVAAVGAVFLLTAAKPDPVEGAPQAGPVVPEVETYQDEQGRWVDRIDFPFVDDPAVQGFWESVDFVDEPGRFKPGTQQFPGDFYLKELNFFPNGATNGPWRWTYGLVTHPGDKTASRYYIENIDGQDYLFFKWKSGDYSIRHMTPHYYVLKRVGDAPAIQAPQVPAAVPDFDPDPEAVGHWETVDFVAQPRQFDPGIRQYTGDLYLKRLVLLDNGRTNGPWTWSKGILIEPSTQTTIRYRLRDVRREKYLFVQSEGTDLSGRPVDAGYFVLRRAMWPDSPEDAVHILPTTATDEQGHLVDRLDYAFVADPAVLGSWKTVDFVAEPEYFIPGRQQWTGDLTFLPGIRFEPGGTTSGPWRWTNGLLLQFEDRTASRYAIRNLDGQDYLFMEWKSGDYSFRHMKPKYYVFRRATEQDPAEEASSPPRERNARTDVPFEDDPDLVGSWRFMDIVDEPGDFAPGGTPHVKQVPAETVEARPGGETNAPMIRWTKGCLMHLTDRATRSYELRAIDGKTYLFMEINTPIEGIEGMTLPVYGVLERTAAGPKASPIGAGKSTGDLAEKIASFPLGTATGEEARRHFGDPERFVIGQQPLDPAQLPPTYCMINPHGFQIFVSDGRAGELRFENEGDYKFQGVLGIGSPLEEAMAVLGAPKETVVGQKIGWQANVLYKDIDGRTGHCYYSCPDKGIRLFFADYKVCALYFPAPWFQ